MYVCMYVWQQESIASWVAEVDIVITTALLPGRPAPRLITAEMVNSMKVGIYSYLYVCMCIHIVFIHIYIHTYI